MISSIVELLQEHPAEAIVLLCGLMSIAVLHEVLWIKFYSIKLQLLVKGELPGSTRSSDAELNSVRLMHRFTRIITALSALGIALLLFTIIRLILF